MEDEKQMRDRIDCLLIYPRPTEDSPKKQPALSIFYPGAMLEHAGYVAEYIEENFDKEEIVIIGYQSKYCDDHGRGSSLSFARENP